MGLDMYLYKQVYIGNYHKKPEEQVKIDVKDVKQERVSYITERVGYWRKANHIHNWFVTNVQEDNDDCKQYYVDLETLQELLNTVNEVLADHSKAKHLLPTTDGFFFGGTEYDNYYFDDLRGTKKIIEDIQAEKDYEKYDYYYQASW